jgi:tetratricopeptide (TPR) repeat protein
LEQYAVFNGLNPEQQQESCDRAGRAMSFSPLNPRYRYIRSLCTEPGETADRAMRDSLAALRLQPTQAIYAQRYGTLLAAQGEGEASLPFLRAAMANDPNEPGYARSLTATLLALGKTEDALRHVGVFLKRQPNKATAMLADLESAQVSPSLVAQALPERVDPWLALAAWWERTGNVERAGQAYDTALNHLEREPKPRSSMFWPPLRFYQQQKEESKVVAVLQDAVRVLPREFDFRLQLGDVLARQGLLHAAREEYQAALAIRPANAQATQRLSLIEE